MRLLKLILIALLVVFALLASVFIGVIVVIAGVALFLFKRWRIRRGLGRTVSLPRPAKARAQRAPDNSDVIDVAVTEVPSDPANG